MPSKVRPAFPPTIKSTVRHSSKLAEPDWVAIDRACSGEKTRLYSNELAIAIHRLLDAGVGGREIARRLGCCYVTVRRHRDLDPTVIPSHWTAQRNFQDAIIELINQGMKTMEIVRKLGCDRKTVWRYRQQLAADQT